MKFATLALSIAFAPLLAVSPMQAATVTQLREQYVEANFKSIDGCITTYVYVVASTSATRVSGRGGFSNIGYASIIVNQEDDPANGPECGTTTLLRTDYLELPAANVQIANGSGRASISGSGIAYNSETSESSEYTISLNWRPNSNPTNLNINYVEDYGGMIVRAVGNVRERSAVASGTVISEGINFTPRPTSDALVRSVQNATIEVTRR
ncbi:MAG TPA: hypothetical protein VEZ50_17520 [Nodosilinea sp.]|jgi:hypothetical protein|nr:hypothetical protein [Nodosilinea sp.]